MSKLVKEMQVHVILHDMDNRFSFKNLHENENVMLRYATIELSTLYRTQPWQIDFIPWNISIHLNVLEKKTPNVEFEAIFGATRKNACSVIVG